MQKLKQELEKISTLDNKDWDLLANIMTKIEFKKGEVIHYGGVIMQDLYYLSSGVAKSSFYSSEGLEYIWQLYFNYDTLEIKNSILDDCVSFYEQTPSELTFEALEDVICYKISMQELDKLYNKNQTWQHIALTLKQNAYSSAYNRIISLMTKDAKTRYQELIKKYPNIFNYVKSYHIALYLGITPQSLSRLKN